jgi:hypothetical protein
MKIITCADFEFVPVAMMELDRAIVYALCPRDDMRPARELIRKIAGKHRRYDAIR